LEIRVPMILEIIKGRIGWMRDVARENEARENEMRENQEREECTDRS
jgi:hypothetical protein